MKFEEVKNKLRENPGSTYSAFLYEKDNHFLSRYLAAADEDDLDYNTLRRWSVVFNVWRRRGLRPWGISQRY